MTGMSVEAECRKQIERDLKTQVSREGGQCVNCRNTFQVLLDGRCVSCYNARTVQIFGFSPMVTLKVQ